MVDSKTKSRIQEQLLSLYLRLNGFFVTGFIVHSPTHGNNNTEVDVLAVRFPNNNEPERQIKSDPLLDLSNNYIDLAICEVKSKRQPLQFNSALTSTSGTIASVLRWAGMFNEDEVLQLAPLVQSAFVPKNLTRGNIPTVVGSNQVRVRGFISSPERVNRRINQPWFITGSDTFRFISQCLCSVVPRLNCATTYDFGLWGEYETIVRYVKRQGEEGGTIEGLYAFADNSN